MENLFDIDWWRSFYSKHRWKLVGTLLVAVFLTGFIAAWALFSGSDSGERTAVVETTEAAEGPSQFTCSMHPQIRQPKPGKCPICGMDLIPVATTSGGMRTLVLSPQAKALMSIQTAPVERRYVTNRIQMTGKVDYDETKLENITAWVPGRLDRLFVDYTGVQVKQGDHMVSIYSEELYSAQEELIQALKYRRGTPQPNTSLIQPIDLVESGREKLRLLGLTATQIAEIEKRQTPSDHITIQAPVGGIVIEKHRQQGDRVRTGDRIYTIADLNLVWVHLDAYESDLPWIKYGQQVTITTEAYPSEQFKGRLVFEQPILQDAIRTVKVRINVPNAHGKLKPGMFVRARLESQVAAGGRVMDPELAGKWISPMHPEIVKDAPGTCDVCGMPLVRAEALGFVAADTDDKAKPLVVPYSAAMQTGRRAVVYVELPSMPTAVEVAFQAISAATKEGNIKNIREAFMAFSRVLDKPYDQPGTTYARQLWNNAADRLGEVALAGHRVRMVKDANQVFARLETSMNRLREQFAPAEQPTFEGREIVLGPRAGDYFLVRHGLEEGELVVTQGNFKIDAEVQIQAKPSMMTPEGGGAGGHAHAHGDSGRKQTAGKQHAGHQAALPAAFYSQVGKLDSAYEEVTMAIRAADMQKVRVAFSGFGRELEAVDGNQLEGHSRMVWKEFAMLLGNDVVEGNEVTQLVEADRIYLLLKGHMRRDARAIRHVATGAACTPG